MAGFVLLAIGLTAILLAFAIVRKLHETNIIVQKTLLLPEFSFLTLENVVFSNSGLPATGGKLIINYFNPDCEHCQSMAAAYVRNAKKLATVQLIMVTIADSASVENFKKMYRLGLLNQIVFLRDTKFQFEQLFGTSVVPSFFVYKKGKLLKKVTGETTVDNLLREPVH